jgi:hypothetical protein
MRGQWGIGRWHRPAISPCLHSELSKTSPPAVVSLGYQGRVEQMMHMDDYAPVQKQLSTSESLAGAGSQELVEPMVSRLQQRLSTGQGGASESPAVYQMGSPSTRGALVSPDRSLVSQPREFLDKLSFA